MPSQYTDRYDEYRKQGFTPIEAFGIVCIGISTGGTMEDLKELDRHFSKDSSKQTDEMLTDMSETLKELEEFNHESITRTVSAV